MEQSLINDLFVIIGLSIIVVFLFNKLRIPSIIGFLLTGMIAGPYGLGLLSDTQQVKQIAEIGVILLLFSIGIDFSLSKLLSIKRNIFLGGGLQVGISVAFALLLPFFTAVTFSEAFFIGFLISLSSTTLIMKQLLSGNGSDSPQGRISLSISIFQDLSILPMVLIVPLLVGGQINFTNEIIFLFVKIIGIGLFVYISIRYIMPNLIFQIAKTRIKELFILSILAVCAITVWLSSIFGISIALGAFLAGLIVSETDYSYEALGAIEPFREVFSSFFFVSIGMLLNLHFFLENIALISIIVFAVVVLKFASGWIATYVLTSSFRISLITGVLIAQIGEYGFVFALVGIESGLLNEFTYQLFLAVTVLTISLNPLLLQFGNYISAKIANSESSRAYDDPSAYDMCPQNHLIIIGFGLNGRNLAKAAKYANIPYIIIEMNPVTVREEKRKGENIIFGDATREPILENACINSAKVIVSTIPDPAAERSLAISIKRMNPNVHLIIRTRYDSEMEPLYKLGADDVIPEEFETSIQLFTRVLSKFNVTDDDIVKFTNLIRGNRYEMFRKITSIGKHDAFISKLSTHRTYSIRVRKGAYLDNKSLKEANLRSKYSLTVLAIQRDKEVISNPSLDFVVRQGDLVLIFGEESIIKQYSKQIN